MKRLLPLVVLLALAVTANAKPVDKGTAARAASLLLHKVVIDATPEHFTECYLFAGADGQGFALIAADDCVKPVLGYSPSGVFSFETMPAHVRDWIEGYRHDIAVARQSGYASSTALDEWNRLLTGSMKSSTGGRSVLPLVTSVWAQGMPFNSMCPYDSLGGENSCVGCLATATAQVMRYWGHPATGRASHSYDTPYGTLAADFGATTYDWVHMPDTLTAASPQEEKDAVALLSYQVGVAMDMMYSAEGSGAAVDNQGYYRESSAEMALKTFFLYNPMLYCDYKSTYTDAEWDSLCMNQLDLGRPLIYAGYGPVGGHAFVVDGYDTMGLFHVNWGWGGYCDGYYTLDGLNPSPEYSFNDGCQVLMDVYPVHIDSPVVRVSVASVDESQGTVSGGGVCLTDSLQVIVLATAAPGYRFDRWSSGNPCNPIITSPTRDISDTAFFVPLGTDTLLFCNDAIRYFDGVDTSRDKEWGICITSDYFGRRNRVGEVRFDAEYPGLYRLNIYRGHTPGTPIYTSDIVVTDKGVQTVEVEASIPLSGTDPVWITLATDTIDGAIVYSTYSGLPDASWIKHDGCWQLLHEALPNYASWPISVVTAPADQVHMAVIPSDFNLGDITGAGLYWPGDTVELVATPAVGCRFVEWSTGSTHNPYYLTITSDTVVIGYFERYNGIQEVQSETIDVIVSGLNVTVTNPHGVEYSLYDIYGRQMVVDHSPQTTIHLPVSGTYILRAEGMPAKRIIVVK